jgi:uncharacterized protein (TIGR02001 family)
VFQAYLPIFRFGLAALCIFVISSTARAIDENIIDPESMSPEPEKSDFDIALGLAVTSDYVSRGITNSDSMPALQGYIEPNYGIFYAGVWSSNVDYGAGFRGAEIDVGGGIRPSFGSLSLDLGYVHYFYSPKHVSPDYGELYAKADYDIDGKITLGARIFFAPDYNQSGETGTFVAGGAKVPLPHDITIYGGVGYQFFEDPSAFEQLAWTVGASYAWKELTFDVRYWDTDLTNAECAVRSGFGDGCDSRIVGTISMGLNASDIGKPNSP